MKHTFKPIFSLMSGIEGVKMERFSRKVNSYSYWGNIYMLDLNTATQSEHQTKPKKYCFLRRKKNMAARTAALYFSVHQHIFLLNKSTTKKAAKSPLCLLAKCVFAFTPFSFLLLLLVVVMVGGCILIVGNQRI